MANETHRHGFYLGRSLPMAALGPPSAIGSGVEANRRAGKHRPGRQDCKETRAAKNTASSSSKNNDETEKQAQELQEKLASLGKPEGESSIQPGYLSSTDR